ncbi:voltage-gated potassium channel [Aureococcus anophagefferens]|nr:voltage-gated potassium channel [Aureococcus anophagefferens]
MRAYNEKMGVVNAWLEFNDLPREMRRKVRTYFKTFLSERSALDEQAILNDLDPGLRAELGQYLIPDAVRDSALFSGLPPTVLAKLSTLLRPVPAAVDDVLQVQGTHGVTMHVVVAGLVEVGRSAKLPARGDSVTLESPKLAGAFWGRQASDLGAPGSPKGPTTTHFLSASDTFGELVVLGIEHTYSATATAREPTALYMIEQAQLYERFGAMPEVINKMRQHAIEAREERQTGRGEPAGEETGKEGAKKRYKHMRSSLVGGGGATLPTGFADTMLEALGDIQHRLEEIYDRLDGIEQAQADPRSEALAAEAALNASLNASVAALSDHRITDNSPEANANRRRLKRFEELLENRSPEPTRRAISAVDAEHWIAATNKSRDRKHAAQAPRSTPAAYRSLAPKDDAAAARPPFKTASSGSALGEHAAAEERPGLARSVSDPSPETAERTLGDT